MCTYYIHHGLPCKTFLGLIHFMVQPQLQCLIWALLSLHLPLVYGLGLLKCLDSVVTKNTLIFWSFC